MVYTNPAALKPASPPNLTKYCCFLPARFALLGLTAQCFLIALAFGVIGILLVVRLDPVLTDFHRLVLFLHIFIYIFFVLFSFLGLSATLLSHPTQTSLFSSLILGQILFNIASGALCLYLLFYISPTQAADTARCVALTKEPLIRTLCHRTPAVKGVVTSAFINMWLVQISTVYVGNLFLRQLREEEMETEMTKPSYDRYV